MLLALRFLTGVALAGIYPVGMKIAAGWFAQGGLGAGRAGRRAGGGQCLSLCAARAGGVVVVAGGDAAIAAVATGGGLLMHAFVPDDPHLAPTARITPRALA